MVECDPRTCSKLLALEMENARLARELEGKKTSLDRAIDKINKRAPPRDKQEKLEGFL